MDRSTKSLIDRFYTETLFRYLIWVRFNEFGTFEATSVAKTIVGSRTARIATVNVPAVNLALQPKANGAVSLLVGWQDLSREIHNTCYSSKNYNKIAKFRPLDMGC